MSIILNGTNGVTNASWTTAGRPSSPAAGQVGFNTTLNVMETYTGSAWVSSDLPAPSTSGNLLTSNGTTWASTAPAAAGSMTLLGTVSATSGNSVSLGSLDLTSYTELHIAMKSVVSSGIAWNVVSSTNSQSAAYSTFYGETPDAFSGMFIFNLVTGSFVVFSAKDIDSTYGGRAAGLGNVTTATTTLYFRLASTNTYSGSGSFKVYGVK